jgi:hypothetical protein
MVIDKYTSKVKQFSYVTLSGIRYHLEQNIISRYACMYDIAESGPLMISLSTVVLGI